MSRALVTGAGRGIGRAIAERLHREGHEVVVLDLDEQAAKDTADQIDGVPLVCDITDPAQVADAARQVGALDILVNNAGIWTFGPILATTDADAERVMAVNFHGLLRCCQAFAPAMIENGGGSIVNISSGVAITRSPGLQVYPSSKAAVEVLTAQMALELRPVRINAVGVGVIGSSQEAMPAEVIAHWEQVIPAGRLGTGDDIADAVAYLVSPRSSYVNGHVLQVDGGFNAARPIF